MSQDELAEINGIKPKVVLKDGEEQEARSASSNTLYKVKRTFDHYYCSCPAWRNQSGIPVNARTCKHLKGLLGDQYEAARLKLKNPDGPAPKTSAAVSKKKPPSSGTKAPAKRKKAEDEEDEEEEQKPAKRARKPTSSAAEGKGKAVVKAEEEAGGDEAVAGAEGTEKAKEEAQVPGVAPNSNSAQDELAEINGIKPKVFLKDGEERDAKSMSSNSVYKVKRAWDHYYCSCPAWRHQGSMPVNARTCKHLKALLGDKYEEARLKFKNPHGPAPPTSKSKTKPKTPAKRKKGEDEGEDEDGVEEEGDDDTATSGKVIPELLLANKWDLEKGEDPTGWWISEKLDGVRTYYDGKQMISRLGNLFTPPQWFLDKLPKDMTLDGELFGGRGEFQSTVSIVKTVNSPHWKGITFQIFDIPSRGTDPFEDRIEFLKKTFGPGGTHASAQIEVVAHEVAKSRQHVLDRLKEIEGLGGEGLMLREPGSEYEGRRSGTLLKIKTFYDAEAVVTGYVPGKGKNKGITGALKCKMESGKTFNVGTGLSDKQRKNPPKIGAIVTYRFQELTRDGVPRFPSYIGESVDKDTPKDAEIPAHRKAALKAADAGE